tara:strand:+ start:72 stop:1577 length:1506 start_codon:yes stop_codon:yes gene_type:complete
MQSQRRREDALRRDRDPESFSYARMALISKELRAAAAATARGVRESAAAAAACVVRESIDRERAEARAEACYEAMGAEAEPSYTNAYTTAYSYSYADAAATTYYSAGDALMSSEQAAAAAAAGVTEPSDDGADLHVATPLSSDSLSSFAAPSTLSPTSVGHNVNAFKATVFLCEQVLPALALELLNNPSASVSTLHENGVSVRHLGWLRGLIGRFLRHDQEQEQDGAPPLLAPLDAAEAVAEPGASGGAWKPSVEMRARGSQIRHQLLEAMTRRTLKNLLRAALRDFFRSGGRQSDFRLLASFFNLISGGGDLSRSKRFWNSDVVIGLQSRFGSCALDESERMPGVLRATICETRAQICEVIDTVMSRVGISLTNEARRQLGEFASDDAEGGAVAIEDRRFEFLPSDFKRFYPRTKHAANVDFAEGMLLSLKAQEEDRKNARSHRVSRHQELSGSGTPRMHSARSLVSRHAILACKYLRNALTGVPCTCVCARARTALIVC